MKILIIFLMSVCYSQTIDSCGVFPFGPDFDLRKNLTIEDVIKKFGEPKSIDTIVSDLWVYYPDKICYFYARKLNNIEIIKGKFQNLEIGMSKKKIRKIYGPCTIIDTLPDNNETWEFGHYDQNWVRYITTFFLKDNKLIKISIRKEDDWL